MDQWWPIPWFPIFPIMFMLVCLIVFLFVMVPMMKAQAPRQRACRHRRAASKQEFRDICIETDWLLPASRPPSPPVTTEAGPEGYNFKGPFR